MATKTRGRSKSTRVRIRESRPPGAGRGKGLQFPAEAAMHRAAKRAREVARQFGTPIYYMKDGKIVAEKP